MLKLIDSKGGTEREQLWMDPYYDLAKLSHSICGGYDFLNSGLFDIKIAENYKLDIAIDADTRAYKTEFRKYLEKYGYDYWTVRVYEISLFLSMLPLHMDKPQKVLGFILNAIAILDEVKKELL